MVFDEQLTQQQCWPKQHCTPFYPSLTQPLVAHPRLSFDHLDAASAGTMQTGDQPWLTKKPIDIPSKYGMMFCHLPLTV